jgi:NAD(P)-dependent dehydrogenase (short-subunit alcohol dehydrogenase family)
LKESSLPCGHRTAEEFYSVLATNVVGPFLTVQEFLPLLRKSSRKLIVNVSTIFGSNTFASEGKIPPFFVAYASSKAALNMGESFCNAMAPPFDAMLAGHLSVSVFH